MVHILAMMSLLKIMPTVTATQKHAWAITILFHLAVLRKHSILAGNGRFSPDEVEVVYLDPSR